MVGTIAPLVQVARRQWFVSTSAFAAASIAAGGVLGIALGILGTVFRGAEQERVVAALLVGVLVVFALIEVQWLPLSVPTLHRSVPQHWWLRYGPTRAALAYGAVLGVGGTTFIPFASFYVLPVAALALGPVAGGVIGVGYGLGRALPVPLASLLMVGGVPPVAVGAWLVSGRLRRIAKRLCALVLLTLAIAFLSS